MKRLLLLGVFALFLFTTSWAYDFSATNDDGVTIYYNILSEADLTCAMTYLYNNSTSNSKAYSGAVSIPEAVTNSGTTYSVISIGDYAFIYCSGLTEITIPNSVTSIGYEAFSGCTGLTEVILPNSVTEIGDWAFSGCSMTQITIPNSVTSIGSYAFANCSGLTTFEVAEGNNSYCSVDGVLYSKDMTTLVQFPRASPLLPSFDIPEGVTTIGSSAFYNCTGLTSVTIPESVTEIGEAAFRRCTRLTEVTIPESVTEIGSYAFGGCTGMTEVTIPNRVTTIGYSAFDDCTGLTEVNFNAIACTSAGSSYSPFRDCDNISTFNFGDNVTIIPDYLCYGLTGLTEISIPESVTSIGSYSFRSCKGIKEVIIPNSVILIDKSAFNNCTGLTSVTIGNSVTSIGSLAFWSCSKLTQVTIPSSVVELYWDTFSECSRMTSVTFEDGENTLSILSSLSSGSYYTSPSFSYCEALYLGRDLSYSNSDSSNKDCYSPFATITTLSSVTIGKKVKDVPDYIFYKCTGMKELNIGESVAEIGSYAFSGCTKLTSVIIPNSVETIGSYAFEGCTGLTSATIGGGTISNYAFYKCTGLKEVTFDESVTSIDNDAFYGCSRLWSISNISKTQSTCTMQISCYISGAESGIVLNNTFYSVDGNGYYTFTDLVPGNSYSFYFGIKLDNGSSSRHGESRSVTTSSINPQITQISLTPESFTATGSYTEGDAVVTETGFTGYMSDGVTLYLTDLEPKTNYTVQYYVTASGRKITTSETFTTLAVEFTTLPAKATSNTVALLGATTNLSDDAVGAGFEWRRYDAPSLVPSTFSECPVIDGELTGTLNGLSASTYYMFRPYYTSQGGTTYYGDWIAFITADAYVYFEPTVRTYEATSVGSESATVKAYAVAGSDEIISQGFEYWEGGSSSAMNVRKASTTDENGVTRIEVSGQWMTATLEDLEPSTTYGYRAYVTTAVGTTYGETMSFTTDVSTGVEGTRLTEDAEVYEMARYTLDGKKVSQPQRGINIIRYSDGTVRKVLVK